MKLILLKLLCTITLVLLTASCGPSTSLLTLRKEAPENILNAGRLGALPVSAKNIQAEGWSGFFTGESYLKYEAEKTDIEQWIILSPSLSNVIPVMLGKTQYETNSLTPVWFRPDIQTSGRKYTIPSTTNNHNWGTVIIDDDSTTVYVRITWS